MKSCGLGLVLAAALLASCSSSGTRPNPPPTTIPPTAVVLHWEPIEQNEDGTPAAVTAYRLAYGGNPSALDQSREFGPGVTSAQLQLPAGQWFFAITARSAAIDSDPSNVVAKTVP